MLADIVDGRTDVMNHALDSISLDTEQGLTMYAAVLKVTTTLPLFPCFLDVALCKRRCFVCTWWATTNLVLSGLVGACVLVVFQHRTAKYQRSGHAVDILS